MSVTRDPNTSNVSHPNENRINHPTPLQNIHVEVE